MSKTYHLEEWTGWKSGQSLFERDDKEGGRMIASCHCGDWLLTPNKHPRIMGNPQEITYEEAVMILFSCRSPE